MAKRDPEHHHEGDDEIAAPTLKGEQARMVGKRGKARQIFSGDAGEDEPVHSKPQAKSCYDREGRDVQFINPDQGARV